MSRMMNVCVRRVCLAAIVAGLIIFEPRSAGRTDSDECHGRSHPSSDHDVVAAAGHAAVDLLSSRYLSRRSRTATHTFNLGNPRSAPAD